MTHLVMLLLTDDYVVSKVDIRILFFCVISPQISPLSSLILGDHA